MRAGGRRDGVEVGDPADGQRHRAVGRRRHALGADQLSPC